MHQIGEIRMRPAQICATRGLHGSFVDRERFRGVAGWERMANCAVCRSTVEVPSPRAAG